MSTAMQTVQELNKLLDMKTQDPAFNLVSVTQALDSFKDPLARIMKISADRKQRLAEEARRKEKNRKNRESLAKAAALEHEPEHEAADEPAEDGAAPMQVEDEEPEPAATEVLVLVPREPSAAVDLSPLQLDAPEGPEQRAELLACLLASQQLFTYAGAFGAESASPVLRVLFQLVVRGDDPHAAYRQAMQHYAGTEAEDMGWVPQLPDFWSALQALGYPAPRGGQARKRSNGEPPADGPGAAPGGGGGGGGAHLGNLRSLLQLLVDLLRLQRQGRLDLGCNGQAEATGKHVFTALLRMQLDPELCRALRPLLAGALEGLAGAWDEAVWRRLGDAAADGAAGMGPSHRAAYRLIAGCAGLGERLRGWQAAAALQLLRRVVPQGGSGGGGNRRSSGERGCELRALLGPQPSAAAARKLRDALKRPRDGGVDFWRLLTLVQCAHLVAWHAVYGTEQPEDGGCDLVRWLLAHFNSLEQALRGRNPLEMRVKVFLAEAALFYDSGGLAAEH